MWAMTAALVLLVVVYCFLVRHFSYWRKRGVACPEPKLLFGHLKDYILRKRTIMHVIADFYNAYPNEKVVGLLRTRNPCLLVRDLELLKHIFIKDFEFFVDRGVDFSGEGLGLNLFHADGDTWRVLRSKLSPIFSSGKLKHMFYLIEERCEQYKKYIDKIFTEQPEQNVFPVMQEFTMSTISACAFGVDLNFTENDNKTVLKKMDKLIFTNTYFKEVDYMFPGILKKMNVDLLPNCVSKFFKGLVKDIVKDRNGMPSGRRDFMDLMLELRQQGQIRDAKKREDDSERVLQVSEHLLAAQAFVFYAAGYETSAATLAHLLHELAYNPRVQDAAVQEITQVLAEHGGKLSYGALKQMKYLKQVFDETLRFYPLVDPIVRMTKAAYAIPGTNIVLEKNTPILVSSRGIHYDESIYPEPHKFDPDRFSPGSERTRHPCAYIPFGAGPRNCIGMRFAVMQSLACLATLLPRWRVLPAAGPGARRRLRYDPYRAVLASKHGVPLRFERRL